MILRPVADPAVLLVLTLVLLGAVVAGAALSSPGRRAGWLLRGLMVLTLAAAALRPGVGSVPADTRPADLEVLLVVDRTTSMSAPDWNGGQMRLDGAEQDADDLVAALPAARFAVVSFGKRARAELPSTSDVTMVTEAVDGIEPEDPLAGRGSTMDRPLDLLEELLRAGVQDHPDRRRVVVLLTDGENTSPDEQASFAPLAPLADAALVLGYGTRRGSSMPIDAEHPDAGPVPDPATDEPALSRLDEPNLRAVSEEMGADYLHRTRPGGLGGLAAQWQRDLVVPAETAGEEIPARFELGWVLALVLFGLALVELTAHWRRLLQVRRELA